MEDNIDNLLDDLDALITNKSSVASSVGGGGGSALPYRVPHRPTNEKSPTQLSNPNPKNKFAISPSPVAPTVCHDNSYVYASENVKNQSYPTLSSNSTNKDLESIDSLLELLDEPSQQQQLNSFQSSHDRAPTHMQQSSSFQSANNGVTSSSTSSFPSFNRSSNAASTSYTSVPKEQKTDKNSDNSFDSLLSDINSSLPDVSSSTMMSEVLPQAQPSKPLSLLQPPPRGGTAGAGKGGRCSRVVIAGSDMSRGVKSSAFSKRYTIADVMLNIEINVEING